LLEAPSIRAALEMISDKLEIIGGAHGRATTPVVEEGIA